MDELIPYFVIFSRPCNDWTRISEEAIRVYVDSMANAYPILRIIPYRTVYFAFDDLPLGPIRKT